MSFKLKNLFLSGNFNEFDKLLNYDINFENHQLLDYEIGKLSIEVDFFGQEFY